MSRSLLKGGESHPSRVRGLKLKYLIYKLKPPESHPSRVRGLKLKAQTIYIRSRSSHPSRVRGLKHAIGAYHPHSCVAPLTGAWIETTTTKQPSEIPLSHPSRVRGLKLLICTQVAGRSRSHPSRVRGLLFPTASNTAQQAKTWESNKNTDN